MRLPPWAIQALRQGAADVAKKASDDATLSKLREQATELFRELPESASRGLDAVLKSAGGAAKEVVEQGREAFRGWSNSSRVDSRCCLNGTGILLHPKGTGVPVAESILQTGIGLLRGDHLHDTRSSLDRALDDALPAENTAVAVANNFDAALFAISALAEEQSITLHRSHAIRLPSGVPLPDAFGSATIRECGGVQSIESGDFEGVCESVLVLADDGTREITRPPTLDSSVVTVAVVPAGSVRKHSEWLPSAESLLQQGIDLVVLPGGPLTAGVASGILAGKTTLVDQIRRHSGWRGLAASDAVAAITLASLTRGEGSSLDELLETGEENLRGRAERMATRLGDVASIDTTRITDEEALLLPSARWQFSSRQLRIRHASLSADAWAKRLAERDTALLTGAEGEELVVDLRWLPPSADAEVGAALWE